MAGSPLKRFKKSLVDEFGLPPDERMFADRYLHHHDAMRALREVYGEKNHRSFKKILAKAEVIAYIKLKQDEISKRYDVTTEWIVSRLAWIAGVDYREFFNEDGSCKPIWELTEQTVAALSGIDVEDIWEGRGNDREHVGELKKFRLHSSVEALHLLMKFKGIEHGAGSAVGDRLSELIAVFRQGPVEPTKEIKETPDTDKH